MTLWPRPPSTGWSIISVGRFEGEIVVCMGHPDWPEPLSCHTLDMGEAVRWTMLRRDGVVERRRGETPGPPNARPRVWVDLERGRALRDPGPLS